MRFSLTPHLWWRAQPLVVMAAFALAVSAAPATAQDESAGGNRLKLSNDGVTFGPSLRTSLFADPPLLVPGEAARDDLWALNASADPAVVSLYAVDADSTLPEGVSAANNFRVSAGTEAQPASSVSVADIDPCQPLVQASLEPGQEAQFALEVALPATSGNVSQRESVSVEFVVDLRAQVGGGARCGADPTPRPELPPGEEANPSVAQPPSTAGPGGEALPRTGSDVLALLLLGLFAVFVGSSLRRAGRDSRPRPAAD